MSPRWDRNRTPVRTDLGSRETACKWGHAHLNACPTWRGPGCHKDPCMEEGCDAGLACCVHCLRTGAW